MKEPDIVEAGGRPKVLVDEMSALRSEIKDLRDENHGLRKEVGQLHNIIDGMRRENMQAGIRTQRTIVESLPRDIVSEKTRKTLGRMHGAAE